MSYATERQYDGFTALDGGIDSGRAPELIAQNQASFAVNRRFRGGYCRTRPGFANFEWEAGAADEDNLTTARIQGAGFFDPTGSDPMIVALIGGELYRINIGVTAKVAKITPVDGRNSSLTPQAYFVQAGPYLIVQDNQSRAIIYDGSTAWRAEPWNDDIPVGGPMAFGLGRVWVARGQEFAAGDIHGGPTKLWQFTENTYLAEGGAFALPQDMGPVTGMIFLPRQDTATGQGELLVFGPQGACSIDPSGKRETWKETNVQHTTLMGIGCLSAGSLTAVNGDVFFRGNDSLRSYRDARAEIDSWGRTPMDFEARRIMSGDDRKLARFSSGIYFDDRFLLTVCPVPFREGAIFQGMLALDFTPVGSMRSKAPPAYDGLWTGIQPVALVSGIFKGVERAFALCSTGGEDNANSIWEITKDRVSDGGDKPIEWSVESRSFFGKSQLGLKRLERGDLYISDMLGQTSVSVEFRPDEHPLWIPWHDFSVCAADNCTMAECGVFQELLPQYRPQLRMPAPPDTCDPVTGKMFREGYKFQLRISGSGSSSLRGALLHLSDRPQETGGACLRVEACQTISGEPKPMFEYLSFYSSTQSYTSYCDPLEPEQGSSTATSTAVSVDSQAAAEAVALAKATEEAAAGLVCGFSGGTVGTTIVGFDDFVSGIDTDEDGNIYVAGAFRNAQDTAAHGVAKLGPTGLLRTDFDTTTAAKGASDRYVLRCAYGRDTLYLRTSPGAYLPPHNDNGYRLWTYNGSYKTVLLAGTRGTPTAETHVARFDKADAARDNAWVNKSTKLLNMEGGITANELGAYVRDGINTSSEQSLVLLDETYGHVEHRSTPSRDGGKISLASFAVPVVGDEVAVTLTAGYTTANVVADRTCVVEFATAASTPSYTRTYSGGRYRIVSVDGASSLTLERTADLSGDIPVPSGTALPNDTYLLFYDYAGFRNGVTPGANQGWAREAAAIRGDVIGSYATTVAGGSLVDYEGPAVLSGGNAALAYLDTGDSAVGPRLLLGERQHIDSVFQTNALADTLLTADAGGYFFTPVAVSPSGTYGATNDVNTAPYVDLFHLSGASRGSRVAGFTAPAVAAGTTGYGTEVFLLGVDDEGRIYLTGNFGRLGGVDVAPFQLYRLTKTGSLDTSFNSYAWADNAGSWKERLGGTAKTCSPAWTDDSGLRGAGYTGVVHTRIFALKVLDDGSLLVGGGFTRYRGIESRRIIKLDENGDPVV